MPAQTRQTREGQFFVHLLRPEQPLDVRPADRHPYVQDPKRLLPGPYTFILPAGPGLPKAFKGKKTVGIRVPDNNIPREIVRALGNPIISTSVYDTDEILEYTTDPSLIAERMDTVVDLVIDGGYGGNIASTVISLVDGHPQVLRQGAGPADEFL